MIRTDFLPSCGYAICQDPAEFPFTTDSVFLGNFPHVVTKARALELGCGTGAVSLLLAARGAAEVTGVDINPRMAELLNRSAALNGLSRTVRAEVLDIRDIKGWCATESFDLVAANPPYRHSGSGRERKVGAIACHEKTAVLEDFSGPPPTPCAAGAGSPWSSCRTALWNPWNWRPVSACSLSGSSGSTAPWTSRPGSFWRNL